MNTTDHNITEDTITKLDSQKMLESIDLLSKQIEHAWQAVADIEVPADYGKAHNIALFGMGGSALGMDVMNALFADQFSVPVSIHNNYTIPAYVDNNTLAILSSYSGTTEEVLEVAKTIRERTEKILIITTGGKLQELAEEWNVPAYIMDPVYNPCNQPRIAVGYAIVGLMRFLSGLQMVDVSDSDIDDIIHFLDGNRELLRDEGKAAAADCSVYAPILVGSEFLAGNIHVTANQINENGKHFSARYLLPELNHHLLEGLGNPKEAISGLRFVFVESNFYTPRVQKRYTITQKVLEKNNLPFTTFVPTAPSALLQSFETLQWGSYFSFYLAMQNGVDPSPIPWVDFFKDALTKPLG